jgi:hypothetical protein
MSNTFKFGNGKWATGQGSVLAYNDENNNFKPLPFNFTRASSATRVNENGLIEVAGSNEPRIDYLNNTDGHLLLEPSRTNSLLQSNKFDTTWIAFNATNTSNQIGVGGSSDAWLLNKSAANGRVVQNLSLNGVQSFSLYAKAGSLNWLKIQGYDGSVFYSCYFDLVNGAIGTETNLIDSSIDSLGSGWYRCSISFNCNNQLIYIYPADGDNNTSGASGSIYIQYSQLETGSYATSYIPTSGSAVTRAAPLIKDAAVGITDIYPSTELTMYMELDIQPQDRTGTYFRFNLQDSTAADNWIFLGFEQNDKVRFYVRKAATNSVDASSTETYTTEQTLKISARIKSDTDYSVYVNGSEILSGTNALIPTNLSEINLITSTGQAPRDKIKDLKLYNTALTDAELIALTS